MTSPEYVTRKQAAEILGVSLPTLDKMVDRGEVPVVRLSERIVRIDAADLTPDAIRARITN